MTHKKNFAILVLSIICFTVFGQIKIDSTLFKDLPSVTVSALSTRNGVARLDPIVGTYIHDGKKNEVVQLTQMDVNVTEKAGRQIFAKVPGVFVYDMDGAGNMMNISARGLDPHRGWEFNVRKDGMLTNSDMYGYPASHYSIPLESVEKIELVRGTGSLQYGAQFGGMLNYVTKQGDVTKPISFESYNSIGSYNLLSTYNAIGGKVGKFQYYAYIAKKSREGYRRNEQTNYGAESAVVKYDVNENLSLKLEWSRSHYIYRMAGQLNDAMFAADPRQATRTRSYFNPTINIPSFALDWKISDKTRLQYNSSAVIGIRNSIIYDRPANVKDTIVTATGQFNNRQVDIDRFNSYTNELRLLQQYKLGNYTSSLVVGLQLMNNLLHRTQQGRGTGGSDFDLSLVNPIWGRDIRFKTQNTAMFLENNFQLLNNLTANIGARVEMGESKMSGVIIYYPENEIPVAIAHNFPLFGGSLSYKPKTDLEFYGGFAQSYRPMIFKDIIPVSIFEKVDPNIKDAKGYNAEIGFRGNWSSWKWDVTAYVLQYNDRFGTLAQTDAQGEFYTYRTNIGNSTTKGLEIFVQKDLHINPRTALSIFTSTAIMDGRYTSGEVKVGLENVSIKNNKIESVPNVISRNGVTFQYTKLSISGLYSYTADSYADALNTVVAPPSGAVGLVPAYGILDVSASYKFSSSFELKISINNVTDESYFTKRPLFYPGPGIWPSDGRNGSLVFIFRI